MQKKETVPLIDPFGRAVTYLRLSVTDRCDFRCFYCMPQSMRFLPRRELLTLEELARLCEGFIRLGTRKIRITGGEPLVRRDVMWLFRELSRHLKDGGKGGTLEELTLTTNGSQLARFASPLAALGVRRVNVSLDTLDREKFRLITRNGEMFRAMEGIEAARQARLRVKINMVALKGVNEDEIIPMIEWCAERGFDLTFIEVMPMGGVESAERRDQYLPMQRVRDIIARRFTLIDAGGRSGASATGGPARYATIGQTRQRIGFITPLTHNFCENCNRVRVTCTGKMYMCLGQEDSADLRAPLRVRPAADASGAPFETAIRKAIARKPKGHDFLYERRRQEATVSRPMSMTGG